MTLLWFLIGILLGSVVARWALLRKIGSIHTLSEKVIQQAEQKAKNAFQTRENDLSAQSREQLREQDKIRQEKSRLAELDKRLKALSQELQKQEKENLRLSKLTQDELRQEEKAALSKEFQAARKEAESGLETEATRLLLNALTRQSSAQFPEAGQTTLLLQSPDIKSKIVGKEGRNLRAFEELAGVSLLIDELPNGVILSCYSPERRFIAERALKMLLQDGRINPDRIQEAITEVQNNLSQEFIELGKEAARQTHVHDLSTPILETLGKLHIRTSFAQNVLSHSIEVAAIMGLLAAEMRLNEALARRIGLLHDIGKALPSETGHSHAISGANFAKLHHEKMDVTNGIACHHEEVAPSSFEAALCKIADTLSAARRGSRATPNPTREKNLEELARSFPGVSDAFALQAGRELRVIVQPDAVDDAKADALLHKLSSEINANGAHPVKITLIRESRFVNVR